MKRGERVALSQRSLKVKRGVFDAVVEGLKV